MNTSGPTPLRSSLASELAAIATVALAVAFVSSVCKAQAPAFGDAKTAQGRVRSFTTAPMGEVDGATLDDGTVIHWPPHLADRFTAIVARGDRVKVTGWMETGPAGDTHLEVRTVTNLRTDATASNDVAGPGRVGSDGFAVSPERGGDVERRLNALEDQITQLREEVRRLSREP